MDKERLKSRAHDFLKSLEDQLISHTPPPEDMRRRIREIVVDAKTNNTMKHMRKPEDAFLYKYAMPVIFRHMQTVEGIGAIEARHSLLCEYYRNMKEYCHCTPARTQRHPFSKAVGTKPAQIIAQWTGSHGARLRQACPDFAVREPFPFKIVFEGKYFDKGAATKARIELVTDLYQAFFYRGLPYIARKKNSPAWDYDFACLLAYDASDEGNLKGAWDSLDSQVKNAFWDGANVYVMIFSGTAAHSQSE
jgi:hypothetical protein